MPKTTGGRLIVAPVGVLRASAVGGLLHSYFGLIEDGAQEVWLDLSDVTAVENAALDAVDRIVAFSHELECRMLVVCPVGNLRRALSDAGIDQDIEVYDSLWAARHAIAATATTPC
jgi:anti-anti-sigma regulatory factor